MDINVTAKAKALFSHYDYVDTQEEKIMQLHIPNILGM